MKKLTTVLSLAVALLAAPAFASSHKEAPEMAAPTAGCEAMATEKKLAGAAKNSFLKKCHKDSAASACGAKASEKKLAGAAKTSFLKKCHADSAAMAASGAASAGQ